MSIKVKLGQLGPSYTLMVKSSDKVMWFIQTAAAMHLDSIPDPLPEGASVSIALATIAMATTIPPVLFKYSISSIAGGLILTKIV